MEHIIQRPTIQILTTQHLLALPSGLFPKAKIIHKTTAAQTKGQEQIDISSISPPLVIQTTE